MSVARVINTSREQIKLYNHQIEAVNFLIKNNFRGYVNLPPGLGKTLIACLVLKEYAPNNCLIVAPKSAIPQWQKELSRLEVNANIYLVNYEKFLSNYKKTKVLPEVDFLILDEAHRIKNVRAKITKILLKYKYKNIPKILLSGTPFKDLIDLYTQFSLIDPSLFGNWLEFTTLYFNKEVNYFGGVQYVPKPNAERLIFQKISKYLFRRERQDILDLKKIKVKVNVNTPKEYSWEALKRAIVKEILEYNSDSSLSEEAFFEILAENLKGTFMRYYRLAQVTNREKHEYILDFLADHPDTLVYTNFVEEAEFLAKRSKAYLITGKTSDKERLEIIKKQDRPLIFTSALSEGADLCNYGNLILATIPGSLIRFQQIIGRIDRISQKRKAITIVYILDEYNSRMLNLLYNRISLEDVLKNTIKNYLKNKTL